MKKSTIGDQDMKKGKITDKEERCVKQVKKKGQATNPYTVCKASIKKADFGKLSELLELPDQLKTKEESEIIKKAREKMVGLLGDRIENPEEFVDTTLELKYNVQPPFDVPETTLFPMKKSAYDLDEEPKVDEIVEFEEDMKKSEYDGSDEVEQKLQEQSQELTEQELKVKDHLDNMFKSDDMCVKERKDDIKLNKKELAELLQVKICRTASYTKWQAKKKKNAPDGATMEDSYEVSSDLLIRDVAPLTKKDIDVKKLAEKVYYQLIEDKAYNKNVLLACRAVNCDVEYVRKVIQENLNMILEKSYDEDNDLVKGGPGSGRKKVKITTFGQNLTGKHGVTGVLTADLTPEEIESQKKNAKKRGHTINIEHLGDSKKAKKSTTDDKDLEKGRGPDRQKRKKRGSAAHELAHRTHDNIIQDANKKLKEGKIDQKQFEGIVAQSVKNRQRKLLTANQALK